MIVLIILLNFTPICEIFFTCKEASVAMLKGQNLSLKKMCPLDLMQENSTKKNDTNDEHRVCCFYCELIASKHKTNNCHPLPTLTKKTYKKIKRITSK